ncbi:MAG TPA: hypothetical protein VK177_11765 [Flavobacteriales bacterium]|nr:hypothetical protein [Flavobacteriales bacterium]
MLRIFAVIATLLVFSRCSTKVELNTDWEDITIVYGLLDQNDEYHWVKINKAFLGDGSYYDYALIRDSSEYDNLTAYVQELSNGVIVNTYPLRDTELVNRPTTGVFFAPEQTVYYFKSTTLNPANTYKLVAHINEGTAREKEVTAETGLEQDFSITNFTALAFGTYNISDPEPNVYNQHHLKFVPPTTSDMYEIMLRIKWDEYTSTDTTRVYHDWVVGKSTSNDIVDGIVNYDISGEAFYRTVRQAVLANNNPAVYKRVFRAIDVSVYAASDDLATYISVNSAQNGLVQERPEFTNVANGLGIFASRVHETLQNKTLGLGPMRLLVHGSHTYDLLFCTDTTSTIYTLASPPTVVCP